MTDEQETALARYSEASRRVAEARTFRQGARGAEQAYTQAYEALCRLGLRLPLKRKYRRVKHGGGRKA